MSFSKLLNTLRSILAQRLGIKSRRAADGTWWEIDFILVLLLGSVVIGLLAFVRL